MMLGVTTAPTAATFVIYAGQRPSAVLATLEVPSPAMLAGSRMIPCRMGVSRKKQTGLAKGKGRDSQGKRSSLDGTSGGRGGRRPQGSGAATPNPEEDLPNDSVVELATAASSRLPLSSGYDPIFLLATDDTLVNQRVGSLAKPPTYEAVLCALLAAATAADEDEGTSMETFVQANRDLLDYRFMYRLTADKLLAGNGGDAARAATLQKARVRVVQSAQHFDTALFKEVGAAEGRLGGVLAQGMQGKAIGTPAVVEACGATPMAAFAFWFVTIAAMSAWEAKLNVAAVADQAKDKLQELSIVRAIIESDASPHVQESGVASLAPLLALQNLAAAEPASGQYDMARRKLGDIASDPLEALALVRRIGCTYCQASRHGFKAYNPAVQHMAALYDVLLYGELQPLIGRDIRAPRRQLASQMVQMANDADKVLETAGVQIPLFW